VLPAVCWIDWGFRTHSDYSGGVVGLIVHLIDSTFGAPFVVYLTRSVQTLHCGKDGTQVLYFSAINPLGVGVSNHRSVLLITSSRIFTPFAKIHLLIVWMYKTTVLCLMNFNKSDKEMKA
jgi:hypothetical protein